MTRTEKPAKTFEDKTESEKKQTLSKLGGGAAKGIMKKPGQPKKGQKLQFGQCQVFEYEKDPESTATAVKVETKDISDMRDEKTKMKDKLQEQENQ